jgi:exonuclease SbcC
MRLDRLEISGFMRFREPAVLDLRELPAGLVAILGRNGEGKTRLLDGPLAGIYGPGMQNSAFPSRDGALVAYATSREARIDTLWDFEGVGTYHARVSVDGVRRESSAVLEQVLADGRTVPLNESGLVKTFREAVARVFPSRRQVLASAFSAQNKSGGFSALDQKGRLELFTEMLDLQHLEAMGETARRCAAACEKSATALAVATKALEAEATLERVREADDRVMELQLSIENAAVLRPVLEAAVTASKARRAAAAQDVEHNAAAAANAQAVERMVEGHRYGLEQLARTQEQFVREEAAEKSAAAGRLAETRKSLDARLQAEEQELGKLRKDRHDRIEGNAMLHANRDKIVAAAKQYAADQEALAAAADQERLLAQHYDGQRVELEQATAALRESTGAREKLAAAQEQAAVIETVPFGAKCAEAQCQFLTMATAAAATIPDLETAAAADPERLARATQLDAEHRQTASELKNARVDVARLQKAIAANTWAKYEPELKHADERIAQYRKDIEDAEAATRTRTEAMQAERALAGVAYAQAVRAAEDKLRERMDRVAADRVAAQVKLQAAEAELETARQVLARTSEARQALVAADAALEQALDVLSGHGAEEARLQAQLQEAVRQARALEAARQRLQDTAARQRQAEDAWLAWRLLGTGLGRDGLPKLEIDAAGPTVSQLVGDLLSVGYGARFTVDLTTQVERADKKGMKEEFAIRIFDNTHGGERDLSDLSGGERVVVEEALRAGILLFNNARQRRPIRTCWRDETTGALDPENVPRYVAMLRRMHALGGFRHTLFVTHSEAAAELADTVIRVENGVPRVERAA